MDNYMDALIECFNDSKDNRNASGCKNAVGLPSRKRLNTFVKEITSLIFPKYFQPESEVDSIKNHLIHIETIAVEQLHRGICFDCKNEGEYDCCDNKVKAKALARNFMEHLPRLKEDLEFDASAAYIGDPAATGVDEVVFAYPGVRAIIHHRIAHLLNSLAVPIIPRIISEIAHSKTGIDIHPAAKIASGFFIDHGTGIVIGETAVIGKNVKIYQGVTLGAKSFPVDENGRPIKGVNRHPIIFDNVTIYAGATILGRVTIGEGATIGGNVWVTENVPSGVVVVQHKRE